MDDDDFDTPPESHVRMMTQEDLEAFSVDALNERITILKGEIDRSLKAIDLKNSGMSAAEQLFK